MKRGRGLISDPAKARAWQDRSRKNQALDGDERAVRETVFASDGHRCRLRDHSGEVVIDGRVVEIPRCNGGLSFQHRRKAGAGGAYSIENGATLCIGHNRWVEDEPDAAVYVDPYLVVREGDPEWHQLGSRAARGK